MRYKLLLLNLIFIINTSIILNVKKIYSKELNWLINPNTVIQLEISDDFKKREIGLMNREKLKKNKGMIFIYDKLEPVNIWMYNTYIPLDIIYVRNYKIIKIKPNAKPCYRLPCKLYPSIEPIDMVIEVNAGISEKLNLEVGDNLIFRKY